VAFFFFGFGFLFGLFGFFFFVGFVLSALEFYGDFITEAEAFFPGFGFVPGCLGGLFVGFEIED